VSIAPETAEASIHPASRRHEWLWRGAFEATLILFGLLGAFALNEWQDARSRDARVATLLTAIHAELEANRAQHERASAYNAEVAERIWAEASKGAEVVPESAYPNGLFIGPALTSAAWTAAQNDPAWSALPIDKVLPLARVYEAQRIYVDDFNTLANNMYALLLAADPDDVQLEGLGRPLQIGVLRDYARRGEKLLTAYRAALEQL
jgi:hypothetical protein